MKTTVLLRYRPTRPSRVERAANLPVMSIGIDDTADTPAVSFADGTDLGCSGAAGPRESGVGIGDGQDEANGSAAESLWTEVAVLG